MEEEIDGTATAALELNKRGREMDGASPAPQPMGRHATAATTGGHSSPAALSKASGHVA
jgi:hypothetical protein